MQNEMILYLDNLWKDFIKIFPKIVISFFVFILFLILARKISNFIKNRLINRTEDLLLSSFFAKIIKFLIFTIGLIVVFQILGFGDIVGGIITGAGLSAVVIGFAFKNIGENFLSGLLLAFNRPFKVGDTIQVENLSGTITSMDFRTTNIKSFDGQDIFIPNSIILNNPLINYTFKSQRRFDFTIQFDYTYDIDKAKKIILDSLLNLNEIMKDPVPIVTVDQLTTSISIKTYYWLDVKMQERSILEIKSTVIESSRKALNAAGIEITDVTQIKLMNEVLPVKINSQE